jgi:hypothetical protein
MKLATTRRSCSTFSFSYTKSSATSFSALGYPLIQQFLNVSAIFISHSCLPHLCVLYRMALLQLRTLTHAHKHTRKHTQAHTSTHTQAYTSTHKHTQAHTQAQPRKRMHTRRRVGPWHCVERPMMTAHDGPCWSCKVVQKLLRPCRYVHLYAYVLPVLPVNLYVCLCLCECAASPSSFWQVCSCMLLPYPH